MVLEQEVWNLKKAYRETCLCRTCFNCRLFGDCALVVDVWFHRVDEGASGLTFEEWDPSADTDASEAPVAMIVNSSELHAAGFDLREVLPLQLEAAVRGTRRTCDTTLK